MIMRKGTFKVSVNPRAFNASLDSGVRKGLVNDWFGIHGTARHGYTVTHLASGLKCGEGTSQAYARRIVEELSELPIDWTARNPLAGSSEKVREWVRAIATGKQLQP
jgi:hypothetical protein